MMRFLLVTIFPLISISTFALLLHPAHKARCSFRYNHSEKIVEVELRFSDQDVEDFFKSQKHIHIDLDRLTDKEAEQLFAEYLSSHIILKDTKGVKYKWQWVGFEKNAPFVWMYLQAPFNPATMDKTAQPAIDAFCSMKSEINFLIDVYEDQTSLQSFITICNQHTHP